MCTLWIGNSYAYVERGLHIAGVSNRTFKSDWSDFVSVYFFVAIAPFCCQDIEASLYTRPGGFPPTTHLPLSPLCVTPLFRFLTLLSSSSLRPQAPSMMTKAEKVSALTLTRRRGKVETNSPTRNCFPSKKVYIFIQSIKTAAAKNYLLHFKKLCLRFDQTTRNRFIYGNEVGFL